MIWNHTDASTLTMKKLNLDEIQMYLNNIKDKDFLSLMHNANFMIGNSSFISINSLTGISESETDDFNSKSDFAISPFTRYDPETTDLTPCILRISAISSFTPPSI